MPYNFASNSFYTFFIADSTGLTSLTSPKPTEFGDNGKSPLAVEVVQGQELR